MPVEEGLVVQTVPAAEAAALAEVESEEAEDLGRVLAEWARKAARKLEKKGRLLVMLGMRITWLLCRCDGVVMAEASKSWIDLVSN